MSDEDPLEVDSPMDVPIFRELEVNFTSGESLLAEVFTKIKRRFPFLILKRNDTLVRPSHFHRFLSRLSLSERKPAFLAAPSGLPSIFWLTHSYAEDM